MFIRLLVIWLSVIFCQSLRAQAEHDSIIVHFRLNESRIDSSYANNQLQLNKLHTLLSSESTHKIDSLTITGSTSPDGLPGFNQELASKRAKALSDYIRTTYPGRDEIPITTYHIVYTWDETVPHLQKDSLLPAKGKVLNIIHKGKTPAFQKQQDLKKLQNGLAYQYIASQHLMQYRYAYCNLYLSKVKKDSVMQIIENQRFTPPKS